MTYRAVLFDLDGTLLDTVDDLADSMNCALARLGFPGHDTAAYKRLVGDGVEHLARGALPDGRRDKKTVAQCLAAMRDEYGKRWANKTRPYAGIPELLDALTSRGVPMAVLSNKLDDFTKIITASLLGKWRFSHAAGARPGVRRKPDPTEALRIARDMAVPPADFLYVGDTGTDMRTANAAGMFPVGALWGFRDAQELLEGGARTLIEKPVELLGLLDRPPALTESLNP
ncbi:MAG: HAD family hydrolase [Planctomycetota bacterium]